MPSRADDSFLLLHFLVRGFRRDYVSMPSRADDSFLRGGKYGTVFVHNKSVSMPSRADDSFLPEREKE